MKNSAKEQKESRFDLHIHSSFSDGELTPFELLDMAVAKNLQGLSITDHDTTQAYEDPNLFLEAKKRNLTLIPGIEVSSLHMLKNTSQSFNIHVLGYNIDLENESFQIFLQKIRKERTLRNEKILQKLQQHNLSISLEDLKSSLVDPSLGRMHIAKILKDKGYVTTIQQAFDLYLQEGKSCYVEGNKFSTQEVIEQIHQAKGKAILAHPHLLKSSSVLQSLIHLPCDGMEVFYGTFLSKHESQLLKIVKERNWIITGGSDFHGPNSKTYASLGSSWVGLDNVERLFS